MVEKRNVKKQVFRFCHSMNECAKKHDGLTPNKNYKKFFWIRDEELVEGML